MNVEDRLKRRRNYLLLHNYFGIKRIKIIKGKLKGKCGLNCV